MFIPTPTTLTNVINNVNLATFPMMMEENVKKHLPKSEATLVGHLDQKRKDIQSKKSKKEATNEEPASDKNTEVHSMFASIIKPKDKSGPIYMDQTWAFPQISSKG